jgi:hypothetical protein
LKLKQALSCLESGVALESQVRQRERNGFIGNDAPTLKPETHWGQICQFANSQLSAALNLSELRDS